METKTCQNCKSDFVIEPEDFDFYLKIRVPAPTFCPECRRQRRLAWMNLTNLYKRDCDLCHASFVSMYHPDAPHVVYCPKCWWNDAWDWRDYGRDFDESKNFFEQFSDLLKSVPLCGLSINSSTTIGSPYNNHAQDLKNCYLTFLTSYNENSAYGVLVTRNKEVMDCSMVMDCDSCYDCMNIFKSHGCAGTRGNARFCLDCYFNRDCDNCADCIGCTNLRSRQYCIFNEQYSKEEYFEIKKSFRIHTRSGYEALEKKAYEFWATQVPKPSYDDHSVGHTGSYVFESKNCKECYDVSGVENGKYLLMLYNAPVRDVYDVSSWGGNLSLAYEGSNIGEESSDIRFAQESGIGSLDIEYAKLVFGSSHVFGGVSVRKGQYVILNREYGKEEYLEMRKRILAHMEQFPYRTALGHEYSYGEFFPPELSPFAYNKTLAQLFNPLLDTEAKAAGLAWEDDAPSEHSITLDWTSVPDDIANADYSILDEVVSCRDCGKGYRFIKSEIDQLRKMKLPLPIACPFCRISTKFALWVENMHLHERVCDRCGIEFKTQYSTDRARKVFCKECYQKEFL